MLGPLVEVRSEVETIPPEHEMRIFSTQYHGRDVRTIELEHTSSYFNQREGKVKCPGSFRRPPNWRELLMNQVKQANDLDSLLFLEYAIPDLWKSAFSELGTGEWANEMATKLGITDFYSTISRMAGAEGRSIFAADIARTNWYYAHEWISVRRRRGKKLPYEPYVIADKEREIFSPNNMRHLVMARGIMQEVIRSGMSVAHFTAPFHAVRVDDFVKRQVDYENAMGKKNSVRDFHNFCPDVERRGMRALGFPYYPKVREYKPTLPPIAYEVDLIANAPASDINIDILSTKIAELLSQRTMFRTENQRDVFSAVWELRKVIDKFGVHSPQFARSARHIYTDLFGWELANSSYVY